MKGGKAIEPACQPGDVGRSIQSTTGSLIKLEVERLSGAAQHFNRSSGSQQALCRGIDAFGIATLQHLPELLIHVCRDSSRHLGADILYLQPADKTLDQRLSVHALERILEDRVRRLDNGAQSLINDLADVLGLAASPAVKRVSGALKLGRCHH